MAKKIPDLYWRVFFDKCFKEEERLKAGVEFLEKFGLIEDEDGSE